jgi:predicted RecB family nuclease
MRFKVTDAGTNGQWAMARYIEAVESGDEDACVDVLNRIKAYNSEDLDSTWAVFTWLQKRLEELPTMSDLT